MCGGAVPVRRPPFRGASVDFSVQYSALVRAVRGCSCTSVEHPLPFQPFAFKVRNCICFGEPF